MHQVEAYVKSPRGLHARPSAEIVREAMKYASDITIERITDQDTIKANARAILEIMMLVAEEGTCLMVKAIGNDEHDAAENVARVIREFEVIEGG